MSDTYDLIVIGGGPGGYVAAERAGERGLRTLLVEQGDLGGVCLNCGCVPSKTFLNSAKIYRHAVHGKAYGVICGETTFDLPVLLARKDKVIAGLRKGVAGLLKRSKVEVVTGTATVEAGRKVRVGESVYTGANILIATGSSPARPPIPGLDQAFVLDSSGILDLAELPERLTIIGGGVIGCEFACFYASLGIPVTVIEMLPEICPALDAEIAALLRKELTALGITFHVGARVSEIGDRVVRFKLGDQDREVAASHVLAATGRVCNVEGLGLEAAGVDFDRRGIRVDDRCATNVPGIWAAGDVTGRQWLAHAASRMGEVVVHNLTGRPDRMRHDTVPGVVYTTPEVAAVGLTEAAAKDRGIAVKTAKRPMAASGRFLAEHDGEAGLVKVVVDAESRALLGVHMIGGACSEIIGAATVMIETEMRVQEIEDIVFPHPTVSELIRDTILQIT